MNGLVPDLPSRFVEFGRSVCGGEESALGREWLVTNGCGGYAMGTLAQARTRRYHGLLVSAADPSGMRRMLLAKLEQGATYRGRTWALASNRWADGSLSPRGFESLQRFRLEGAIPAWRWSLSDALLEQRIFMVHGEDTTAIHFRLVHASEPLTLSLGALACSRDHHSLTHASEPLPRLEPAARGVRAAWGAGPELFLQCCSAVPKPVLQWWRGFRLDEERARGYDFVEDLAHLASFELVLEPGASALFLASTAERSVDDPDAPLESERSRQSGLLAQAGIDDPTRPVAQLVLAADQFVVERPVIGTAIVAGYPWFAEWSRDALFALPGLLLATGRLPLAKAVLRTLARSLEGGLLPNRFPDRPQMATDRNSIDAPLAFIAALHRVFEADRDGAFLREMLPHARGIVEAYEQGTAFDIGVDRRDGLVRGGQEGVQLTWMDAKVGDLVVTPRRGKPVEVNALWYHGLCSLARFHEAVGEDPAPWRTRAERVRDSFARYWNPARNCCFDLLDGPEGDDPSVRPNQLFAVGLPDSPLPPEQARKVVDTCMQELWTPIGVRTLAPSDPAYRGQYEGDTRARDLAYHQGTVWPWLLGILFHAHARVHGDPELIAELIEPAAHHLAEAGLGSVSEVCDGDPPYRPGGCPAQAWSVGCVLDLRHRVLRARLAKQGGTS